MTLQVIKIYKKIKNYSNTILFLFFLKLNKCFLINTKKNKIKKKYIKINKHSKTNDRKINYKA